MIYNTLSKLYHEVKDLPSIPEQKAQEIGLILKEHVHALSSDLYQHQGHALLYRKICALDPRLAAPVIMINWTLFRMLKSFPVHTHMCQPELSHLAAFAAGLNEVKIEKARAIIAKTCSGAEEQAVALAAWIDLNQISLASVNLTPEELRGVAPYLRYVNYPLDPDLTFPNAQELSIKSDTVTQLELSPSLREFWFEGDALQAIHLPDMPYLKNFTCKSRSLTRLTFGNTPELQALTCLSNPSLTTVAVPNAPRLDTIWSNYCSSLTTLTLGNVGKLRRLFVSYCPNLTTIEAENGLSNCSYLDCQNSTNLRGLPQLPPTVTIYSGPTHGGLTSFRVNPQELDQNPRKVLLDLGQILLNNQPFPNVVWIDPLTNEPAKGIDAGGLRRQLVTTLCENLFKESFLSTEDELALRTFARLIALCSTSSLLLGEHLPDSFFYAVRAFLNEEELEEYPITPAVAVVAKELKSIPYFSLAVLQQHPAEFIKRVKGKPATKEAFLAHLQPRVMYDYFERFISENPHKLGDLVELFTSSRTLGNEPITITVKAERDPNSLPLIHTCSREVEMPLYPTYALFKEKLNLALSTLKTFENC